MQTDAVGSEGRAERAAPIDAEVVEVGGAREGVARLADHGVRHIEQRPVLPDVVFL